MAEEDVRVESAIKKETWQTQVTVENAFAQFKEQPYFKNLTDEIWQLHDLGVSYVKYT